jgi:hypothetical protein
MFAILVLPESSQVGLRVLPNPHSQAKQGWKNLAPGPKWDAGNKKACFGRLGWG